MSFTPGIPKTGQSLGNSRPQVQGNFDYINTAFSVNHVAFNSSGVGKHKFLQMPERGLVPTPIPTTGANEGALYTKESGGITNLFWRQESNGTEIQLTNLGVLSGNDGYSFLPGGFLIQWGFVAGYVTGTDIFFPIPFPNNNFNIQVTQYDAASNSDQRAVSVLFYSGPNKLIKFAVRITTLGSSPLNSSGNINYVAIGR